MKKQFAFLFFILLWTFIGAVIVWAATTQPIGAFFSIIGLGGSSQGIDFHDLPPGAVNGEWSELIVAEGQLAHECIEQFASG